MRKQRKRDSESTITLRLWTYAEAVNALPYLRAVVRSQRQHWLELQRARLQLQRMDARPGRPDRQGLILRAEIAREVEQARDDFEETLRELQVIDVYCLDPAQGLALIPFGQGEELAWYVFDLFAPQGVESWQFHADPRETRRPLDDELHPGLVEQVFSSRRRDSSMSRPGRPRDGKGPNARRSKP